MNVLVVGSGGREHALVWKIAQSKGVKKIFCAPGNAGISNLATCVPIDACDIDKLIEFALENKIDLTIVGPEDPLAMGIVDAFEAKGLVAFGASKKAAELESSKAFAKNLMNQYGIPTAFGKSFTSYPAAEKYLKKQTFPLVVKADGLAAGKGVIICQTEKEGIDALKDILQNKAFGKAGSRVVIEECLVGEEVSFLALTDGKTILPLPSSQDHKRVFDDDKGPNTGGMGAYSPAPLADRLMHKKIMDEVMTPTINAMAKEGRLYKGIIYAGLMIDKGSIKVLEFNARFGDPETQPLMMRIKSDLLPLMLACINGNLHDYTLDIDSRTTVCVVMASGGYPGSYKKGKEIKGLDTASRMRDCFVFHAGTSLKGKKVVSNGGRVLGVTALGESVEKAIEKAYKAVSKISWQGSFFRKDIGGRALNHLKRKPRVGIIMGSDSDLPVMDKTVEVLKKFDIPYEITIASAHRTPDIAAAFSSQAIDKGMKVIVAGAGHAAHLAGAMAAGTTLPIIDSSDLQGLDALLSTVQMPPGVPVATVAVGKPGATNAGVLAAQIVALTDPKVAELLVEYKKDMARKVVKKAAGVNVLM